MPREHAGPHSFLEVGNPQLSRRILQHLLHPGFRFAQPVPRRTQPGHAFLEQGERLVEVGVLGFQLADDLFQPAQVGAEGVFGVGHGSMITGPAGSP